MFTRGGTTWTQQAKLIGTGAVAGTWGGYAVALSSDGNTALTGGPSYGNQAGTAWVFTRSGSTWAQQSPKLSGGGQIGQAEIGYSAALSADGETAMLGAPKDNQGVGAAWVFTRSGEGLPEPAPTVTSVTPDVGISGTTVTITGTNLTEATAVRFGSTNVTSFTVNSATSITAVAPAGAGTVDVTATTFGGTSAITAADQFNYLPAVTSVTPGVGPEAGGTTVTITGTNLTEATAVRFDSANATSFTVNSATSITAISPAGTGTVDVTVTAPHGTSPTGSPDRFSYLPPPTVTRVKPQEGRVTGGTSVTITGTRFSGATAVKFGATDATTFTVKSATSIQAKSPAGRGAVDVTVTTPTGGTSATTPADQFHYLPVVTKVSSTSGPVGGGTAVTVTGLELAATTSVKFGLLEASSVTVDSDESITAVSPEETAGTVNVRVSGPDGMSPVSGNDKFKFAPTVTGVSPNTGSKAGGTPVTVTGTGFALGTTATTFKFGTGLGISVNCTSTTSCSVVSPSRAAGKVDVKATVNKVTSLKTPADQFTYK